ncbi:MAG: class II aldolase/adducin family protein, partial [Burkholderiales bacterium]
RFIHGEIYRARPDVIAVVHSHSPSVVPFAASSERLRPIYHMAGFLGRGAPVFDMRERFGDTDLLVRSGDQGRALCASLGTAHVALMRGHGFVAAGPGLPQAVYFAIYTELNARLQREAIALGGRVSFLSDAEAKLAEATIGAVVERPWELWKKHALETR